MRHIDHHTLELLFLASESVKDRRRSLERHLAGCPDCRNPLREIEEIYTTAGDHLRRKQSSSRSSSLAVARRTESLLAGYIPVEVSVEPARGGPVGRFIAFARRHPAGVAATSLASVALTGFAVGLFVRDFPKDNNPAGFHYEPAREMLSIQNKAGDLLWEKSVWKMKDWAQTETQRRIRFTGVEDLDGDGTNEVVTSLPLLPGDGLPSACIIRVFDSKGNILRETGLGHTIHYSGSEYPRDYFGPGGLEIVDGDREKEIVATVPGFRSPSLIARLNNNGKVLGEYWHYGHLASIYNVRVGANRDDWVLVTGINDVEEKQGNKVAVIALLDPRKINDIAESSVSAGFGYPHSRAEEVYLRIPKSDIASALGKQPVILRLTTADSTGFRFIVVTSLGEELGGFEYVFSQNLEVRDVLPLDGTQSVRDKLLKEGQVRGKLDQAYLDALANSVEYWDGRSWHREFRRVEIQ